MMSKIHINFSNLGTSSWNRWLGHNLAKMRLYPDSSDKFVDRFEDQWSKAKIICEMSLKGDLRVTKYWVIGTVHSPWFIVVVTSTVDLSHNSLNPCC
jgi:hypothetical protein